MIVLFVLGSALPETLYAAQEDDVPENILSMEYSTDASGSTAFTFSVDKALSTHDRIRLDIGSTYFPDTAIGGAGSNFILGYLTDPAQRNSYGIEMEYARYGKPINYFALFGSLAHTGDHWMFDIRPAVKRMIITTTIPPVNQTEITSTGLALSATYYTQGGWSFTFIGEKNLYFGDQFVMKQIADFIRITGVAPFLSGFIDHRIALEADYIFTETVLTFGMDQSRTVMVTKYSYSLYSEANTRISDKWNMRVLVGAWGFNMSSWFASLGLALAY